MTFISQTTLVTPAQAGARLFFSGFSSEGGAAIGSQAPDQVRGDDKVEGLLRAIPTTPVTLNSFQGPSRLTRRSAVGRSDSAVGASTLKSGCAARWVLKQVQHDVFVGELTE